MTRKEYTDARKASLELRRAMRRAADGPVTAHYLAGAYAHRDEPPALREAHGFLELYRNMDLELWPEERFAGTVKPREAAGFHYGSATWVDFDGVEKRAAQMGPEEADRLREAARWLDGRRYHSAHKPIFTEAEYASIQACAATSTWFGGHMVLDYRRILDTGLGGYARDIGDRPETDFYRALAVQLEALQVFIRRYADKARACAQSQEYDADRFLCMAARLDRIAEDPPRDFREALQLVWILHVTNGADSFGRFDSYLSPFYERDLREGRLTREEAWRDLVDIWIRIEDADSIQNMTIGGVRPDGSCEYGDLTALCVEVTRDVGLKGPNLCLRVSKGMPDRLWELALDCLGTGVGLPALYRDEGYVDMLTRAGYGSAAARDYCLAGCSQVMISGQCNFINDIGLYNITKVMELTLFGGTDPLTGKQVGPETPPLARMRTFDELMAAFWRQNEYFIRLETRIHDKDTLYRAAHEGYVMRSLFTRGCVESGRGIFEGGAKYNNIELEIIGITNAADSLYAVKKAVFEEKRFSAEALLDMLRRDFEGCEAQRLYLQNSIAKFGNDEEGVDALRAKIAGDTFRRFNETPAVLGGVYVPGEVIFTAHEYTGSMVGATPDGRHARQVLADSMGSCQGMDRRGPTALMRSVCGVEACGYFLTTPVLNLRFLSSMWRRARESGKLRMLFETFFQMGGMQLQINVCDGQVLRAARENPQEYRSLVVRVGGYSDYFVNLSPRLQAEIIQRTEQVI